MIFFTLITRNILFGGKIRERGKEGRGGNGVMYGVKGSRCDCAPGDGGGNRG